MANIKNVNYRGFPEIEFETLNSWNSFDDIISILSSKTPIQIIERIDGPESRICTFSLNGYMFVLTNNPYGNSIRSKEENQDELINEYLPIFKHLFE